MTPTDVPKAGSQDHLLDLYKLAVEMADRVSARRATANSFFFTVQAGLSVALGAFGVNAGAQPNAEPDRFVLALAAIAGVIIAGSWWLLLRSYRDLNSAKFKIIGRIEQNFTVRLFEEEWQELNDDRVKRWRPRYLEQGQAERAVPLAFLLLYATLAVYIIVG